MSPDLSISRRIRSTPFTGRVTANGVKSYTVYNHMLLPTVFHSLEEDYWHLCKHVQVWDVSAERQVEIQGPDAQKLVQLMTPRDLSKTTHGQCYYAPLCDESGMMLNDPIAIKHNENHWWLSIASSDILLWAKGLATGFGLDVTVIEPDVWPLAVQGPKAEQLVARVFGDEIKDIRFFRYKLLTYADTKMLVARSGWSKQGGFEIYVNDADLGRQLWDELFANGKDLNVRAGCPNQIERVESGLLSYGNDMDCSDSPLECGLDKYLSLNADINSLSIKALRLQNIQKKLVGLVISKAVTLPDSVYYKGKKIASIRSQTWSPRYKKQLAFAMVDVEYLANHAFIDIEGVSAKATEIPFNTNALCT